MLTGSVTAGESANDQDFMLINTGVIQLVLLTTLPTLSS